MANYSIIGTGKQGTAALYDILLYGDVDKVLLIDSDNESIYQCLKKVNKV